MTNGTNHELPTALEATLAASIPYVQAKRAAGNPAKVIPAAAPQINQQAGGSEEHHTVPEVYRAIGQVAKAISREGVAKDSRNQQQGYSFRGIDAIFNALSPLLAGADLCILPRMVSRSQDERPTAKGGVLFYVVVQAEFDFVSCRDGSQHTVAMYGEGMDSADKATNKAMSAAYKYACLQVFCIPTEGIAEDADATTPKPAPKQPQPKPELVRTEAKPWTSFNGMLEEFAKVRELLPDDFYVQILADHGVRQPEDFRRGPKQRMSENAEIARTCYRQLLKAAADTQALAADPTTYQHFEATEGRQ